MKSLYRFLIGLHIFVGVGAVAGGLAAILNPISPLGMPTDVLKNSPFSNFLIPGIILFAIVGVGNLAAAMAVRSKWRFHGYISSIFNWALMIWIVVQCIMLQGVAALHIIYFIIGLIGAILSMITLFKQSSFPTNIIISFYKKINKEL